MTILAVDNSAKELEHIKGLLARVFPLDTVITESDPLAAGKYSFHNKVDVLYAALGMTHMDGLKLVCFVRRAAPEALTFLIVPPEHRISSELWADELDGQLTYPPSEEALREAFNEALQRRGCAPRHAAEEN